MSRTLLRHAGDAKWLLFYGALALAWALLILLHAESADLRSFKASLGSEAWIAFCQQVASGAAPHLVLAMWLLMGAAMMAPTLIPALSTLTDLIDGGHAQERAFAQFSAGYLLVWAGFGLAATSVQLGLSALALLDPLGELSWAPATPLLLALAGLYQFSKWKEACLSRCRQPLTFFIGHWDEGALRMGVRMGAVCLGCCWALMALAFVGGMSSLALMALAALLMTLEKLPQIGRYITAPLGVGLLGAALFTAFN